MLPSHHRAILAKWQAIQTESYILFLHIGEAMDYLEALSIAKNPEASFVDLMRYTMHAPTVEPTKRKHGEKYAEHQFHRFPIRDGITKAKVLADNMCKTNVLMALLVERGREQTGELISVETQYGTNE
jgi:hypothetical protein